MEYEQIDCKKDQNRGQSNVQNQQPPQKPVAPNIVVIREGCDLPKKGKEYIMNFKDGLLTEIKEIT